MTPTARMVPPWNVPGVLYSLLTASVLPAIAAAAKLITLVYSVRRMTNEDGNNRSAHSCLCLYRTRNGSTELAQNPWNIRKPRCLCGASLSVICWDWTGASALKRMPEPLAGKSAGSYLGLGRKGLRPQSPHVSYNWNSHFSSAGSTSFPVYPYASAFPVPNANQFRSAKARSTHACVISGLPKAPSPLACSLVHSFLRSLFTCLLVPCSLVPLFTCSLFHRSLPDPVGTIRPCTLSSEDARNLRNKKQKKQQDERNQRGKNKVGNPGSVCSHRGRKGRSGARAHRRFPFNGRIYPNPFCRHARESRRGNCLGQIADCHPE